MNAATVCVFAAQFVGLFCALAILGYPLARLVQRLGGRRSLVVTTPLLGLYPLCITAWLCSDFTDLGVRIVLPALVGAFAVIDLALLVTTRRRLGSLRALLPAAFVLVASCGVYVVLYRTFFTLPYQTPATLGNLDMPSFANGAEVLLRGGFDSAGNIVGRVIGPRLREDTTGTFFVEAVLPALTGRDAWQTTNSTLLCGVAVMICQLRLFLHRGMRVAGNRATGVAIVAGLSPMAALTMGHGYISQFFGMALLYGGMTVVLTVRNERRSLTSGTLQVGFVVGAVWFVYPLIAVAMPFLALATLLLARSPSTWRRRLAAPARILLYGYALAALMSLNRFFLAVRQASDQAGSEGAGFPLPGLLPHEMFGLTGNLWQGPLGGPVGWAGLGLSAILAVVTVRTCRGRVRSSLLMSTATVALCSYAVIFAVSGVSYQQWKWAAIVAPLFVSAIVCLAIRVVQSATVSHPRVTRAVPVALVLTTAVVFGINDVRMMQPVFTLNDTVRYISPDVAALADDRVLAGLDEFSVQGQRADEMWIASMYPTKQVYLQNVLYYDAALSHRPAVLADRSRAHEPATTVDDRDLNGRFALRHVRPNSGASVRVLDHSPSAHAGEQVGWTIEVTNTSDDTWVSRGDDAARGFSVDVDLVRRLSPGEATGDPANDDVVAVVQNDIATLDLPQGTSVAPGASFVFHGSAEFPPLDDAFLTSDAGKRYRSDELMLQFDPKRQDTGNFLLWTGTTRASIQAVR